MARLVIVDPQGGEREVALTSNEAVLGRDGSADVTLASPKISRRHARLYSENGEWWIEDLESANGTYVGGTRISGPVHLVRGTEIRISNFTLHLVADEPSTGPGVQAGRFVLRGLSPPCTDALFALAPGPTDVGRSAECGVVIADASVSRRHARLTVGGRHITVQDLGSSNGTFINDEAIEREQASNGDRLRFGDVAFDVILEESGLAGSPRLSRTVLLIAGLFVLATVITLAAVFIRVRKSPPHPPAPPVAAYEDALKLELGKAKALLDKQAWSEAEPVLRRILERDPINSEAKRGLERAQNEPKQKTLLEMAKRDLERNDPAHALSRLVQVSKDSAYAEGAAELAKQAQSALVARSLEGGNTACRREDWRECHKLARAALDTLPSSPLAQALVAEAENGMRQKKQSFTPWVRPPELGGKVETLDGMYRDSDSRQAAHRYAAGDLENALKRCRGGRHAKSSRLRSALTALKQFYEAAMTATKKGDASAAVAAFTKALAVDGSILPRGFPSVVGADMQTRVAEHLFKLGEDAMNRGAWKEAFARWQDGLSRSPNDPRLLDGINRLETRAAGILGDTPQKDLTAAECARLEDVLATTTASSPTRKAALERRKGCKS